VEAVEQPLLLLRAGDRAGRVGGGRAVLVAVVAALVVAELPGVEHVERGQPPPVQAPVQLHVDAAGDRGASQRHVLVVGLERRRAAGQEVGVRLFRDLVGPVVLDLVVVEDHRPRRHRVGRLQVQVRLVLGVALAVVRQGHRLRALVVTRVAAGDVVRVRTVLVLVVAQVQDQLRLVLRQPPVRGEVAVLVLGAGHERHRQGAAAGPRCRRGAGTAGL
jgi:hypothetical protein